MMKSLSFLLSVATWLPLCMLSSLFLLLVACTEDAYEKGEGDLSLMQADLALAHTQADTQVDYFMTDDGDRLAIAPARYSWAQVPDTFYRAAFYYKKTAEGKAEVISTLRVNCFPITPKDSLKEGMKTDPVQLESTWMAKNRLFLNLSMYLMVGQTDDKTAKHRMAFVHDTLMVYPDGKSTLHLLLYHDQGRMPAKYSQRAYFSIPLSLVDADSLCLRLNTYEGMLDKRFKVR